jgi:Skp family chaperone for outer membrane proteins
MMKMSAVALSLTALGLAVSVAAQRPASVPAGSHVAYVSGQRVARESNEGKAGTTRLQAIQQEKAADIRAKQQALEAVRQELGRAADAGTRTKLEQEEAQRRGEFERAVAQAQLDIQNSQRQISNDLLTRIRPILEDLVAGTDVQVVLQADGPILWAAPGLDLTPVVIERLNALPAPKATAR